MSFLITFAAFIVAIGVLVTVHEYGHYRVAKSFGINILTFSIGFGHPLFTWKRGETDWQLAVIPLGGYVKMLDEREAPVSAAELDRAFNRQSVGRRMAVVVAGPLANLLLAVLVYWFIFMTGVDITLPRLGAVAPGSPAAMAGFVSGDTFLTLDGNKVDNWADVRLAVVEGAAAGAKIDVLVQSLDGAKHHRLLDLSAIDKSLVDGDVTERQGLSLVIYKPQIGSLLPGGAAEAAGLRKGDRPVSVDGQPISGWPAFVAQIKSHPGVTLTVGIVREGQTLYLRLTPKAEKEGARVIGRIGATGDIDEAAMQRLVSTRAYGPVDALRMGARQTWDTISLSLRMMWHMLSGHVSVKQLSGPVAIASYAGQTAKLGLRPYLEFLCLISISLGVLNLLPIPVLDGGHLLYYSAELLRGRPLSERAMELGQRVGVGILAVMMAVAMFNDISRLVGS